MLFHVMLLLILFVLFQTISFTNALDDGMGMEFTINIIDSTLSRDVPIKLATYDGSIVSQFQSICLLNQYDDVACASYYEFCLGLESFQEYLLVDAEAGRAPLQFTERELILLNISFAELHDSRKFYTNNQQISTSSLLDVIISISSCSGLTFLEHWKTIILPYHLIIVCNCSEVDTSIATIPSWADFEFHNINSISNSIGDSFDIFSFNGNLLKAYGYLVSDKHFVFAITENSFPCFNLSNIAEHRVDIVSQHLKNLMATSSSYSIEADSGYSDSYRYSGQIPENLVPRRANMPTPIGISLGQVYRLKNAGSQCTTCMCSNTRSASVPNGVLFSMSSDNVAFDRKFLGLLMFSGFRDATSHFSDIFVGWLSKTVCDHLNVFVAMTNSGYRIPDTLQSPDNSGSFHMGNIQEIYDFFVDIKLSDSRDVGALYLEISELLRSYNGSRFIGLADDMRTWFNLWSRRHGYASYCDGDMGLVNDHQRQLCTPQLITKASGSSEGPSSGQSTCAVFTLVRNEKEFLPLWIRYYSRHVAIDDMWILYHLTDDNSTDAANLPPGIHVQKVYADGSYYLRRRVEIFAAYLLRLGYKCYVYSDVDEFLVPDPLLYKNGLREYLEKFVQSPLNYSRALGKHMVHFSSGLNPEPPFSWEHSVFSQRHFWIDDNQFSKTLVSKICLTYLAGFHRAYTFNMGVVKISEIDNNLILLHLKTVDLEHCIKRERFKYETLFNNDKVGKGDFRLYSNVEFGNIIWHKSKCGLAAVVEISNEHAIDEKWNLVDI